MSRASLPWEIEQARDVLAHASTQQHDHQDVIRDAVKRAARADQLYRVARARKAGQLRDAGKPAVMCDTLARGDEEVAALKYDADVAEGDREVAVQEGWRLHANRKDSQELAEWSKRRDLAEFHGRNPEIEPSDQRIFGGRRTE